MRLALIPVGLVLLGGCAGARRHLTDADFELYKSDCAAPDAYLTEGKSRGVMFKGVSSNRADRAAQVTCLTERMRGTDVRLIGFLSTD
jgi:hypothetical protein